MGRYYRYGLSKIKNALNGYVDVINREIDYLFDEFYKEEIKIRVRLIVENTKKYDKVGILYKGPIYKMYEWYIGDDSLGDVLFNNTGKKACLIINY